jgi:hypothetical protein
MQVNYRIWRLKRAELFDREENLKQGARILSAYVHRFGLYDGTRHYNGVIAGSHTSYDYADHVFKVAGFRLAAQG